MLTVLHRRINPRPRPTVPSQASERTPSPGLTVGLRDTSAEDGSGEELPSDCRPVDGAATWGLRRATPG